MSQQKVIKELHSIQFALKVQDAILNGYRVTRTFGKPDMQYKAILTKVGGLEGIHKINYQQNLDLKDVNQLHFALKLQQAILGGYRIKVDKRFGKFGVCWYASLEIGKGQLEELLKEQSKVENIDNLTFKSFGDTVEVEGGYKSYTWVDGIVVGDSENKEVEQTVEPKQPSQEVKPESTDSKPTSTEVKAAPKKRTTKQSVNKE